MLGHEKKDLLLEDDDELRLVLDQIEIIQNL
jgi:hypothetical protein